MTEVEKSIPEEVTDTLAKDVELAKKAPTEISAPVNEADAKLVEVTANKRLIRLENEDNCNSNGDAISQSGSANGSNGSCSPDPSSQNLAGVKNIVSVANDKSIADDIVNAVAAEDTEDLVEKADSEPTKVLSTKTTAGDATTHEVVDGTPAEAMEVDEDDGDCNEIQEKVEPTVEGTIEAPPNSDEPAEDDDNTIEPLSPQTIPEAAAAVTKDESEAMEVDDNNVIAVEQNNIEPENIEAVLQAEKATSKVCTQEDNPTDIAQDAANTLEEDESASASAQADEENKLSSPVFNVDDESQENGDIAPVANESVHAQQTQESSLRKSSQESCEAVPISSDSEAEDELSTTQSKPSILDEKAEIVSSAISTSKEESVVDGVAVCDAASTAPKHGTTALAADPVHSMPAGAADDDDDDDDCVLIEPDDDQMPFPQNPSLKRKSFESNDLSVSKRARLNPSAPATVGQLTIKDARSLMPSESFPTKKDPQPFGMSITSVTGGVTNPSLLGQTSPAVPKLVLMNSNSYNCTGTPNLTNNASLLPGLTEDMFVLEAPSFIVPYIYEKPPPKELKDVVKKFAEESGLSDTDLAVADKKDEFDMMTEQNKANRRAADASRGKKKREDDSWSEQSEDDEDDEDSEAGMRTKVLIKEASNDLNVLKSAIIPPAAVVQSQAANTGVITKPGQENYFESPLGKFFMDISIGLVQEYVQSDLLRIQKRKQRKSLSRDTGDIDAAINALSGNLQASKTKNSPYKFTLKKCEFCNFKSESSLAMAHHYETPHMNGIMYKCNFCVFEVRSAQEIVYHMEAIHNIKARLIKPLSYHQCSNCSYEDNGKAKLARHQPVCAKKFRPETNLAPPSDWEGPAKIPRVKPRHGLVGTATAYQAMAAQAAAQKAALATLQAQQQQHIHLQQQQQQLQHQQTMNVQRSLQNAAALSVQNASKMRAQQRIPPMQTKAIGNMNPIGRTQPMMRSAMPQIGMPNYQLSGTGQAVQGPNRRNGSGQPSISITPLPRQASAATNPTQATGRMPQYNANVRPYANPTAQPPNKIVCEICDGQIKDTEQLRNHMQFMHKVKIHQKMINNRPPLNCQKCQKRFFTDQGLERHLLGTHGLVTSSMQEAANQSRDGGRCPICGKNYQWKLLTHVSKDHHMTLKPAHLSYKCTVCTATFGMYKQFETHVYNAHTSVANKATQGRRNNAGNSSNRSGGGAGGSGTSNASLLRSNEALLKPLKINDEITIIPQPATKSRMQNMESHVID